MPHEPATSKNGHSKSPGLLVSKQTKASSRQGTARKKRKPRPRVKISVAMRTHGVDEFLIARKFRRLVSRLEKSQNEKLLLDALKECCKLLEAYATPHSASGSDPVKIVLDVPRPDRADPCTVDDELDENSSTPEET